MNFDPELPELWNIFLGRVTSPTTPLAAHTIIPNKQWLYQGRLLAEAIVEDGKVIKAHLFCSPENPFITPTIIAEYIHACPFYTENPKNGSYTPTALDLIHSWLEGTTVKSQELDLNQPIALLA